MYATFSYNANRQRYKQVALAYDGGTVQRTTAYVGDVFEKVTESGASTFKHYVRANGALIAVQLRTSSSRAIVKSGVREFDQAAALLSF